MNLGRYLTPVAKIMPLVKAQSEPSGADILGELVLGAQVAITHHVRSCTVAVRKDVRDLFAEFVATEIDEYEKLLHLAKARHALESAPLVSPRQA